MNSTVLWWRNLLLLLGSGGGTRGDRSDELYLHLALGTKHVLIRFGVVVLLRLVADQFAEHLHQRRLAASILSDHGVAASAFEHERFGQRQCRWRLSIISVVQRFDVQRVEADGVRVGVRFGEHSELFESLRKWTTTPGRLLAEPLLEFSLQFVSVVVDNFNDNWRLLSWWEGFGHFG